MKILRGSRVPNNPTLTVVVMAVDSDLMAISALHSIDDPEIEKILVNTGTGTLSDKFDISDVILVESPVKQLPGGTRNLGIQQSSAQIISFLASDCVVNRESTDKRIAAHAEGFQLVSSTLRPASNSFSSWASYIYVHRRRMPEFQKKQASFFGVSYHRDVFDKVGFFNETMRVSEDADFNTRCAHFRSLLSEEIITYHRYPETLFESMSDASSRAVREMRHRGRSRTRQAISEFHKSIKLFVAVVLASRSPARARFAALLLPLLGASAAFGCFSAKDTCST